MSLKAKILQALKTKHKNKGFGDKAFDAVATFLDATVTEETEIDAAIEGVENLFTGFQGDADGRINAAIARTKAEKDKEEKGKKGDGPEEGKTPKDDDTPVWAKGLTETISTLKNEIAALKAGKTTDARKAELESKLANAIPAVKDKILKDFHRMKFETDDEFNAYLAETEEDLKGFEGFGENQGTDSKIPAPAMGQKGKTGISTDTEAYLADRKAVAEGKTPSVGKQIFQT